MQDNMSRAILDSTMICVNTAANGGMTMVVLAYDKVFELLMDSSVVQEATICW